MILHSESPHCERTRLAADSRRARQNHTAHSVVVATHLADTFVVKETQSVTKDSGVVPVMSSHCAGDIPPAWNQQR